MNSGLADFIETHSEGIVRQAVVFARSDSAGRALADDELRDHLPQILQTIVADLRTSQSRDESIRKSQGLADAGPGQLRSAAGTHAVHRAHSGFSIESLVAEYRALRASVLRMWSEAPASVVRTDEITRFNEAIDQAVAESVSHYAQEVERWRNIFLGLLGHDLRGPLTAIMVASEVIARMAVDAPLANVAQRLVASGERMRELLDKLLVYNRVQMGIGLEVEREDADLAQACREEVAQLREAMPNARILLEAPDSARGHFDVRSICQALANLVVNAYKYGLPEGDIQVRLRDAGPGVELSVANHGQTIPAETLRLLFEPLRRGGVAEDGAMERASLGLGLFIVSQIAEAHGGGIHAESENGLTRFTMQLAKR